MVPVSKRLRYEILRRDNHTCRYCGGTPPDVTLTVDHVIPVTLRGTDEPSNLVAACRDCNAGKSASNPDQPLLDDVAADALRWANAIRAAAAAHVDQLEVATAWHTAFNARWIHWETKAGGVDRPQEWRTTVDQFREASLPQEVLHDAVRIAMENHTLPNDRVWRYFCGIAWRRVEQIRADALAALRADEPTSTAATVEQLTQANWLGVIREATLTLNATLEAGSIPRALDITRYLLHIADYGIACGHPDLDQCTDRCQEIWDAMAELRPTMRQHLAALRNQPVGWPTLTGACA